MVIVKIAVQGGHSPVIIKFPDFSRTSSEHYGVSTLATASIQNEMHVISHCNTHICCHNYDSLKI